MKTPHQAVEEDVSPVRDESDHQALQPAEREGGEDLEQAGPKAVFNTRRALWAFLVLCYSVSVV